MMKVFFFLISLFLSCFFVEAQNLSGSWTGFLDQSEEAQKINGYKMYYEQGYWKKGEATHAVEYSFQQHGDKIVGIYYVATNRDRNHYARFSIAGNFENGKLKYRTSQMIEEKEKNGMGFCFNEATLEYSIKDGYEYLIGKWKGWDKTNYPCAGATVSIRRKLLPLDIILSGKVLDEKTGKPILAEISLQTEGIKITTLQSDNTGTYQTKIVAGKNYTYQAVAKGYLMKMESLSTTQSATSPLAKNIYLRPIEVNEEHFILKNVIFAQSEAYLLPESFSELDQLFNFLQQNSSVEIILEGHTDIIGNPDDNMKLSEKRVKTVKDYLVKKGIAAGRIEIKAYGSTKPLKTDGTDEDRKVNRRVEFKILKK
jgi:outer membrane protein OmpA-like peptidoglycan-associated protein